MKSLKSSRLMSQTPFSFAFFSILKKNSEISPHFGPCNLRIRCHLPLIIPSGDVGMEIAGHKVLRIQILLYYWMLLNVIQRLIGLLESLFSSMTAMSTEVCASRHCLIWTYDAYSLESLPRRQSCPSLRYLVITLCFSKSLSLLRHIIVRHPELQSEEIEAIIEMFDGAKSNGWLK